MASIGCSSPYLERLAEEFADKHCLKDSKGRNGSVKSKSVNVMPDG